VKQPIAGAGFTRNEGPGLHPRQRNEFAVHVRLVDELE
jgi:hypothetical protein